VENNSIDETLRGTPHNVTTEMDLALWRLTSTAVNHRELLLSTPPGELATRYGRGAARVRARRLPTAV